MMADDIPQGQESSVEETSFSCTVSEGDEYVHMQPNPPHIMSMAAAGITPQELLQRQHEINLMYDAESSIRNALENRKENQLLQHHNEVQNYLRSLKVKMLEIGPCQLIRTKSQASAAARRIALHKRFIENLERVPSEMFHFLVDTENIMYEIKEEQMFLQGLCIKSISNTKAAIQLFDEVLTDVTGARRTRHFDAILAQDHPLPLEFFEKRASDRGRYAHLYPKPQREALQELIDRCKKESRKQNSAVLVPITEEPILPWENATKPEKSSHDDKVVDTIKEILRDQMEPSATLEEALHQVNEAFGTSLTLEDQSLLTKLTHMLEQKAFFSQLLRSNGRMSSGSNSSAYTTPQSTFDTPASLYNTANTSFHVDDMETPRTTRDTGARSKSIDMPRRKINLQESPLLHRDSDEDSQPIGAFIPSNSSKRTSKEDTYANWNHYVRFPEDDLFLSNCSSPRNLVSGLCDTINFENMLHRTPSNTRNNRTQHNYVSSLASLTQRDSLEARLDRAASITPARRSSSWNKTPQNPSQYRIASRQQPSFLTFS